MKLTVIFNGEEYNLFSRKYLTFQRWGDWLMLIPDLKNVKFSSSQDSDHKQAAILIINFYKFD